MFLTKLLGRVRNLTVPSYGDGEPGQMIDINPRGEGLFSQGLPERSELVRQGKSWGAAIPTGSAFTFVAAWPTTRSELVLQNGEDKGGATYIIDRVWLANITSQAAAQPYSLLGQLVPAALNVALVADNTAVLRHSLSGKLKNYTGRAQLVMADTTWAVANQWFTLGDAVESPMTTNLGGSLETFCFGRYLVPPGAAFCLAGLAGTAAGTAIAGIEWHEAQLPLN